MTDSERLPRISAIKVMAATAVILGDDAAAQDELGHLDPGDLDAFLTEANTLRDLIIKQILNLADPVAGES